MELLAWWFCWFWWRGGPWALLEPVCPSRLYLLYNHWLPQVLLYLFIVLDLGLAVFEEPALIPLPAWVRANGG